jgi:hypothetical protein
MKTDPLRILFFIIFINFGCFLTKTPKEVLQNNNCIKCDSILQNKITIKMPIRKIDGNLTGVPLINKNLEKIIDDSACVFTRFEAQNVQNSFFCFLGKKNTEIDFFLMYLESDWFHLKNQKKFGKSYYYSLGDYFENGNIAEYNSKNKQSFKITNLSSFTLIFTKISGDTIYTGTFQDSLNLLDCQNKLLKQ